MELMINKGFYDLTHDELYSILRIRQEIFVVEQDCVYLDSDGLDANARHFFMKEHSKGKIIAYARVIDPGVIYEKFTSIGRVLVDAKYRDRKLGRKLMKAVISYCQHNYENDIKISAQIYLNDFYESLGFKATGQDYLEDGIPHRAMVLKKKD